MRGGAGRGQGRKPRTTSPLGQLIAQRGVRKQDVAAATGIPLRTMHRLIAGQRPSLEQLARLAKAFDVSPTVIDPAYREVP